MFNFFNIFGKKIDTSNIKSFNDAMKVANFYISEKNWDKAHKILSLTKENEKKLVTEKINNLDQKDVSYESIKSNLLKNYNIHLKNISDIESKLEKNENKFKFIPEAIKKYKDAIKSINTLIYLKEWDKAKNVIVEIKSVEKEALDKLLLKLENEGNNLDIEGEKKKQLSKFKKKEKELNSLLLKINEKESEYIKKRNKEKFKIRFQKIKNEIEFLSKTGKSQEALNILKAFLSENKENSLVINFYNKEKIKILKNITIQKKIAEEKLEKNIRAEAMKLAGKTIKIDEDINLKNNQENNNFFSKIKEKINFYKILSEKLKRKQLLDEVTLLIEENKNFNQQLAKDKLANIHKGLTKEINISDMNGYDLYGKILGSNIISGDTFGINTSEKKYNFFLGDATGHGIKAGLIVTLFTKLFNKHVKKKPLNELAFEINNELKQDLQSRNFITGVLFEIEKNKISTVKYVGMGHEPMLLYRKKTNTVQKIVPGGLAAGIREIKNIQDIKIKEIELDDGDIILTYSDGIIESKNSEGIPYGLSKLEQSFKKISHSKTKSSEIYKYLIDNIILFRGGSTFNDDASIILIKRDEAKDIQGKESKLIKSLSNKEGLDKKDQQRLEGKNKEAILYEIKKIKQEKKLKLITENLKKLYQVGEFLKLKQEAIRYIKAGHVHKDINFYLKKALQNETKYKISLKNKKIENKYNIINQLYKNGDYETVIRELEDIISKDGDI